MAPVASPKPSPKLGKAGGGSDPTAAVALASAREAQLVAFADCSAKIATLKPQIVQFAPQIAQFAVFCELTLMPLITMVWAKLLVGWAVVEPHLTAQKMQDLVPAICGIALCFFGGTFLLLIASVDAFRLAGFL